MKNQLNEMVTLEWLLPLLTQQLSQVLESWQDSEPDFMAITQHYHQISGALTIANMPKLSRLATGLNLLTALAENKPLDSDAQNFGVFIHQLLHEQLSQYVRTGRYQNALLDRTLPELTQILQGLGQTLDDNNEQQSSSTDDLYYEFIELIDRAISASALSSESLRPAQYKQLLLVWRQQAQQLLATNTNDPQALLQLAKVSRYLWQADNINDKVSEISAVNTAYNNQHLWYLAELWLSNLAQNEVPLPNQYAKLLSALDQALEIKSNQSSEDTSTNHLIIDIYLQMGKLTHIDAHISALLSHGYQEQSASLEFLPRILTHLESVIFDLDKPQALIAPLQQIENELARRGWRLYEAQVSQILHDLKDNMDSEASFISIQWQIESQLQELYSAIMNSESAIDSQIGRVTHADTANINNNDNELEPQNDADPAMPDSSSPLSMALANIKSNFSHYVSSQQTCLSPSSEAFSKISSAFNDMNLPAAQQIIAELELLFAALSSHKSTAINNQLVENIAEGFATIELLVQGLAQHVFDQNLIQQAAQNIAKAHELTAALTAESEGNNAAFTAFVPATPIANNVTRYGDDGEIAADNHPEDIINNDETEINEAEHHKTEADKIELSDPSLEDKFQTDSIEDWLSDIPSDLLPFIHDLEPMSADADDADPDIKAIFIEEAEEVLADIIPLYAKWRENPEDLTELEEVRRGFHTLKGSGRMVGANYSAELAWAIENMLNRVLERSIVMSTDMMQLIADVLSTYPKLVDIFAQGDKDYPAIVTIWAACANAYSKQQGAQVNYIELRNKFLADNIETKSSLVDDEQPVDGMLSTIEKQGNEHKSGHHDEVDNTLKTIRTVNEVMAETPVSVGPQSEEELAFCEIFIEEAQGLLQDICNFVNIHQDDDHIEVSDAIVRAFHTLRAASGSSALAAISDISATIEYSLEQLQQQDIPMNQQHLQALSQSVALIEGYLNTYQKPALDQTEQLKKDQDQQELASLQALLDDSEDIVAAAESKLSVEQLLRLDIESLLDAEWQLVPALNNDDSLQRQAYINKVYQQIELLTTHTNESLKFTTILNALSATYQHVIAHPELATETEVQYALLAGHEQLIELFDALAASMSLKIESQVLDDLYYIVQDSNIQDNDQQQHSVKSDEVGEYERQQLIEAQIETIDTDSELLAIFLEEAQDLDRVMQQAFSTWLTDINSTAALKELQRYLHTIKGGARMVGISSIGNLTHEAETIYERLVDGRIKPTEQWAEFMQAIQDVLSLQITHISNYQQSFFANELIEQWRQFEQSGELPHKVNYHLPVDEKHSSIDAQSIVDKDEQQVVPSNTSLEQLIEDSWPNGRPDPDILEVYLEEVDELIADSSQSLKLFLTDHDDSVALQSLQRNLHTIKGGARMVAANSIADLAHEMETIYEALASQRSPITEPILKLLTSCHDWIADAIFVLKQEVNPQQPIALTSALQQFIRDSNSLQQVPTETLKQQRSAILTAQIQAQNQSQSRVEGIDSMPPVTGSFAEQEQSVNSNEMIRISGSLIEHMINLSGESAINRARIDMGMNSLTNSIGEMGATVQRLSDQLRRMEIELEAQILSQIDDAELINNEDFDPLEMDQYSSLNQLSKSLTESASDLVDINNTLLDKTRDSESLLLQLSRTQTELQDGLMNSRMVPFTRLRPRLERIVRQVASELNKSVELSIINANDEMDRTILERITSPLEHMLRNAVDHGIEDAKTRLQAGKDSKGHIRLEVSREGSEIVIDLSDDGGGIDVEAVRDKAIAQGSIDPNDTSLTDIEVMQHIFDAGLTTTNQLTQISGRGVGMDVVISEIRQLGGMVSVSSKLGKGSSFIIRVPLTVAISDALVVRAADRYYAVPLVQIERVIRINPEKLYDYYQSNATTLSIDDEDYRVRYLNEILSGHPFDELMVNSNTSLPLIIIKNRSGQKQALQVDEIAGSRIEVVVKPLGRQLSHLAGISAATIMGDGSVMFILDLIALMRNASALKNRQQVQRQVFNNKDRQVEARSTILVVDDSVTVRKVTSRFLERQGISVMLAKDGIDAIEILQETIPDLILLDIEMPRMDGFEVATQVRHSGRLKQIPIIMITSRTGEKHRQRALDIGVNDYMGKPFQENELLNKIQLLLPDKLNIGQNG
ncbi:Hpt domain-containing protein [Psychrobacter jeotgali]|uniref:Hpt domain-containing protein n=1 Tax=Psychrobacter jeotgali TaxID=179010 RepID=UPI001919AA35|nr:Hpt domain-containing protein [Psychrobacter jeotgali]